MAQLHSLCFPSPTSIPLHESNSYIPSSISPFPSLSLFLTKPKFLSLHRYSRLNHICSSSSSSNLTIQSTTSSESNTEEENCPTRLLAQNVPWTSTADDIRALFQNYGTVVDVELSMHNKTRNRGLAFVEMSSVEEAAEAFSKLEAYEYEGRTLRLTYAKPKKEKTSPPPQSKPAVVYNLFLANLAFAARAKDLKEFFQSAGCDVVSAEVIFNENPRRSSGYGFVSFKTKKEADEALINFDGKELMGRPIRVARSKRFVKLESDINSQSEDGEDGEDGEAVPAESDYDTEQSETVDNLF